eukprot:Gb_06566 [translate_table: standard]
MSLTHLTNKILEVWMLNVWIATRKKKKLPPGPPAWPIVGNLFQLGKNSNQSLFFLARKYGPLMTLRLGMKTAVVGQYRKRLSAFLRPDIPDMHLRRDQVSRAVEGIYEDCLKKKSVNIGHTVFHTSFNLLGNMILSQDMFDPRSNSAQEFKETIGKYLEIVGTPNMADYFPLLQFLDLQGDWQGSHPNFTKKKWVIIVLDIESNQLLEIIIMSIADDILLAGGETTATTIEWAMAELILNPEKLKKAQAELEEIVRCNRKVEECDTERLPYLQAVVKEVFRLQPAAQFLIPHRAENCCEIGGFFIPKNAQIIVNVWAIGRDPGIWNEAMEFIPERFMQSDIDYKGHEFELIPFGAGRRICVGLPLASRMVLFVLASLVHSFEWSLPDGEQIDMSETFAVALQKVIPLNATPTPRLPSNLYVC